jgi:hypothetical protein
MGWKCRYHKPKVPGGTGSMVCESNREVINLIDKPKTLYLPPGKQCVPMPNGLTYCYMKYVKGLRGNPRKVWKTFVH